MQEDKNGGIIAGIVGKFLSSQLSVMLMIISLLMGISAILLTPREEEPQIVVPMADIFISAPGSTPREVEQLVATPLEKLLWQIDGVEYVYSMSAQDRAVVTVRFFVGEDRENSILKLHNRIQMHTDQVPSIVKNWVVKPVEIDDVPIVTAAIYSDRYDDHQLRRIGEELLAELSSLENISGTKITGGRKREVRIEPDMEKMSATGITLAEIEKALRGADLSVTAGHYSRMNQKITVSGNSFLTSAGDVKDLVIGVKAGRPVYLRDIARIFDGPEEAKTYTRIGFSNYYSGAVSGNASGSFPAVTLAISKKKGTNAVTVAENVLEKLSGLEKTVIPDGVHLEITRNYGLTAEQKVDELLTSLAFAIASVVVLLALVLGIREASVVAAAVPLSFSLALFVNFLMGYTINRVTLFALILSLGLVVDDPITNVDNIQRHIKRGIRKPKDATLDAVREVLPPVIMSTIAIIICFTPLFFITGMMGPYMSPMAANVPLTVTFSTLFALTVVPWMSFMMLKNIKIQPAATKSPQNTAAKMGRTERFYRWLISPFLDSGKKRLGLYMMVIILLMGSMSLAVFRKVPLKLLPFDNKNEFQIVLKLPESSPLEKTDSTVRQFEHYLRSVPEVTSFTTYAGVNSPMDFNGLVRHYYLRTKPYLADIRVNLLPKDKRSMQSHEILLRLRKDLEEIAASENAEIQLVEVPPGPPVLSTIVAEIYGSPDTAYESLLQAGESIKELMGQEPFVVDIGDQAEHPHGKLDFITDREKAALHGISTSALLDAIRTAVGGKVVATIHRERERNPLEVKLRMPREKRTGASPLLKLPLKTSGGKIVDLGELVSVEKKDTRGVIFHKNLKPVVYVTSEMAGRAPAYAVMDMQSKLKDAPMKPGVRVDWAGEGEWKITLRVFRDMGIAFAAALVGIYIILIINTGSISMPLLIMMAIPLTLLGILPGFYLLNLIAGKTVGGFESQVFFTATSMIGMIALGGIVIRNSLVLIEFIQEAMAEGVPLKEAILRSGTIRMRPILLTAMTTAIGAFPITLDPVFSGLAWALIFGLLASTVFTLVIIPVAYFAMHHKKEPVT